MTTKMYFILIFSLVMQNLAPTYSFTASHMPAGSALEATEVPLYHREQVRELLGSDEFKRITGVFVPHASVSKQNAARQIASVEKDNSADLAKFVQKRTSEFLPKAWKHKSRRIAKSLIDVANKYKMDPVFLMAVIRKESSFNPAALGRHGEIGLMQIKPSTATWIMSLNPQYFKLHKGETPADVLRNPVKNIQLGAAYLSMLRGSFKETGALYVNAYNMGAGNLRTLLKNGERPSAYSDRVLREYTALNLEFYAAGRALVASGKVASNIQTFAQKQ